MLFRYCTLNLDLVLVFKCCLYSTNDIYVALVRTCLSIKKLLNRHGYCRG